MDLCAVHVKNLFPTNSFRYRPISSNLGRTGISFRVVDGGVFEITVLRRKSCCKGYRPFVVSATGKKNHDNSSSGNGEQSIPEGDGIRGNNDGDKSNNNSEQSHHINLDWREFRAKLYRDELVMNSLLNGIYICHLLLLTCNPCMPF